MSIKYKPEQLTDRQKRGKAARYLQQFEKQLTKFAVYITVHYSLKTRQILDDRPIEEICQKYGCQWLGSGTMCAGKNAGMRDVMFDCPDLNIAEELQKNLTAQLDWIERVEINNNAIFWRFHPITNERITK